MPFEINPQNAYNLLVMNEGKTGFYLNTISVSGNRYYRITMTSSDLLGNSTETYYYFSLNLDSQSLAQGTPVIIPIPFVASKFTSDSTLSFISLPAISKYEDILMVQDVEGQVISGATFDLYYMVIIDDPNIFNAVPQLVYINKTYSIGSINVKFIYYRMIGNESYYTNAFGDRSLDNEYTSVVPLPSNPTNQVVIVQIIDNIMYYFILVSDTPNTIVSNGLPIISTQITDVYSDDSYTYTMTSSSPNIPAGGNAVFGISIQSNTTGDYLIANNIKNNSLIFNNSSLSVVSISDDPNTPNTIDVVASVGIVSGNINARIYIT